MVVPRWFSILMCWLLVGCTARADDAQAKQLFEQGVAASEAGEWDEAARAFEASLVASDKPATRFNLMLAQRERKRPLEVARHALVLLSLPAAAHREEGRAKAAALLAEAKTQLTLLDVTALPGDVELKVDGKAPELVDQGLVYVRPGVHRLELWIEQHEEEIELLLSAGQTLPWPLLGRGEVPNAKVAPPSPPVPPGPALALPGKPEGANVLTLLRTRAAWTAGGVGAGLAIAAVTCLWVAELRGERLSRDGIEAVSKDGYYSAAGRYQNALDAVTPLAFAGGALMAAALPVGGRILRRGSLGWAIASLALGGAALGAGTYFLARTPGTLVPETPLHQSGRQVGGLVAAAALPLFTYGIGFLVMRKHQAQVTLSSLSSLSITW